MRYPGDSSRRSNSIQFSGEGSHNSITNSAHDFRTPPTFGSARVPHPHHPLRFPSSSSQDSQESHSSLLFGEGGGGGDGSGGAEPVILPGQAPPPSSGSGDQREGRGNIETISEHVLFGNNNGQNSFLYLYYSSSSSNNQTANSRRPYTTTGVGIPPPKGGGSSPFKMGSSDKSDFWKGLAAQPTEPPPPLPPQSSNNNEEKPEVEERIVEKIAYPVYLSPVEGSPVALSPSPGAEEEEEEAEVDAGEEEEAEVDAGEEDEDDSRTSSRITGGTRQDRLDSFGQDLLDDDWDKIYSVPDVPPDYLGGHHHHRHSEPTTSTTTSNSNSTYQSHHHHNYPRDKHKGRLTKEPSTTSSNSHLSVKRVRVAPGVAKYSSSRSTTPSRTPSTRSLQPQPSSPHHGVTSHHHKPLSGGGGAGGSGSGSGPHSGGSQKHARIASNTTGDGIDGMSFQFRNGIGAFFGTPASRQIAQKKEPSPEEMYEEEMRGWRPRLATGATIFMATTFILSCVSLLFVFPILVDPILVGFEAQFSPEPVTCRTTNFRNGSGPSECATPSCREGCTLDLFSCIFVDVEYPYPPEEGGGIFPRNQSATLLINVNGCGYPPDVSCGAFERKYAHVNSEYPCHFSHRNRSIVVPEYSPGREKFHLILAVTIPFGIIGFSGVSLLILIKYHKYLKQSIYKKFSERKKEARRKRREERERNNNAAGGGGDVEMGGRKKRESDEEEEEEEEGEEDHEPQKGYNYRRMQNGASRNGKESTRLMLSTEM